MGWAMARDLAIATTSVLFSMWVAFTAGYQAVYQAMLLLLIGVPIYAFLKARRERRGDVDEPVESTVTAGMPTTVLRAPTSPRSQS
jgi:basic amino acid/polyamine antiporter, APA family